MVQFAEMRKYVGLKTGMSRVERQVYARFDRLGRKIDALGPFDARPAAAGSRSLRPAGSAAYTAAGIRAGPRIRDHVHNALRPSMATMPRKAGGISRSAMKVRSTVTANARPHTE
jgi:hypothetical protein